jgi:biopolymer transport protein ExbD
MDRDSASANGGINLTPIIDIVFLLIIFFVVVNQFIEQNHTEITLPDNCAFAEHTAAEQWVIVEIALNDLQPIYKVNGESVSGGGDELISHMARVIDRNFSLGTADERTVVLRADKGVSYGDTQYALAAIESSTAEKINIAALKKPADN